MVPTFGIRSSEASTPLLPAADVPLRAATPIPADLMGRCLLDEGVSRTLERGWALPACDEGAYRFTRVLL